MGKPPLREMYHDVIVDAMEERGILPKEVKNKFAKTEVSGHGFARCSGCQHSWASIRASVIINIKKQKAVKIWQQKCNKCDKAVEMKFKQPEFEGMIDFVMDRLVELMAGTYQRPARRAGDKGKRGPAHDSERCEKCGWGKWKCWLGVGVTEE